ncbi:hypothetical protein Salat_2759800 [Sesamum alatum]|uniref:Uncharacterized protein n=1 Tax=Sesamum alatum TaxID=300844 RepID=A0AAE1XL66_9LAMI|nr:hypothetical protein Salat_2759800 [Sesamum alatum]
MFHHDKAVAEQKIHELQEGLDRAQAKEKEASEAKATTNARVAALEAQLSATLEESKKKVVDALESGRTEGSQLVSLLGRPRVSRKVTRPSFSLRSTKSPSPTLDFKKQHLQRFVEGFDQNQHDSSLDPNLQPYPEENAPEVAGEDEFATLVVEIGNLP